jgi:hypothetical protein
VRERVTPQKKDTLTEKLQIDTACFLKQTEEGENIITTIAATGKHNNKNSSLELFFLCQQRSKDKELVFCNKSVGHFKKSFWKQTEQAFEKKRVHKSFS